MLVLSKLLHQKVSKMCQNGPHNDLFVSSPIIFPKDWVSLLFAELVGHCAEIFLIWVSRYLENAYPTHFLTSKDTLFVADEHDFSAWVLGFHNKVHEIVSRNTGFIHPAVQIQLLSSKSLILVNLHYGCLILLAQEKCSQVAWF